ncbi:hypothetical protein [uncultured Thiodictyon sp.]|uniref:hypothetical protein n=1 Tax=uncultured Thiodictyon sp. TaxID=1846217 RepID=UPI0025DEEBFF|nr:hypothetical protein [uncultured Thiodictyon sp.]
MTMLGWPRTKSAVRTKLRQLDTAHAPPRPREERAREDLARERARQRRADFDLISLALSRVFPQQGASP